MTVSHTDECSVRKSLQICTVDFAKVVSDFSAYRQSQLFVFYFSTSDGPQRREREERQKQILNHLKLQILWLSVSFRFKWVHWWWNWLGTISFWSYISEWTSVSALAHIRPLQSFECHRFQYIHMIIFHIWFSFEF